MKKARGHAERELTANERQLNRTLDRLERLQRLRKGDYVPAPLSVSREGPLNGNSEN